MRFFVPPHTPDDFESIEAAYAAIANFAARTTRSVVARQRIYDLRYKHDGHDFRAAVGEVEPRSGEQVFAILKGKAYLICTLSRGVEEGEPLLVDLAEAYYVEAFEGYEA